jgi:hypothetical protein
MLLFVQWRSIMVIAMNTLRSCTIALAVMLANVAAVRGQDKAEDSSHATVVTIPGNGLFVPLTAGYQGIAATSATIGAAANGLPCSTCISGESAPYVALPMPLAVVTQNSSVTITVALQDTTYTGPCRVVYNLKQGKTVIQTGSFSVRGGCVANTFNYVYFNETVPAVPGATVLQGVVTAGSIKSSVTVPITIQ